MTEETKIAKENEVINLTTLVQPLSKDIFKTTKIKDYEDGKLFDYISSNFYIYFLDLQEIKKFITYLYENKGELFISELFKNFEDITKEFKENFYK